MNEKEYALQIKNELIFTTEAFINEPNFNECSIARTLADLLKNQLNTNTLIEECKKINVKCIYAKDLNNDSWKEENEISPCLVFTLINQ